MKTLLKELLVVALLAGFGGLVRTLTAKDRDQPYNWRQGFIEVVIAIFAGLLMHWSLTNYPVSEDFRAMAVALSGYSARGILNVLDHLILNKLKNYKG